MARDTSGGEMPNYDVFISYCHQDNADHGQAEQLVKYLESAGYSVWWDRSLLVGDNWDPEVTGKMKGARRIVALISKRSLASENCRFEVRLALGDQKLLPVMLEALGNDDIPGELRNLLPVINRIRLDAPGAFEQIRAAIGSPVAQRKNVEQTLDALSSLMNEGAKLRADFESHGDTAAIKLGHSGRVRSVTAWLERTVGRSYAVQFQNARGNAWMGSPHGRSVEGGDYWQDIGGKLQELSRILVELRQRDRAS